MRNMSFFLTTPQFRAREKDITRRYGWKNAKPGDRFMGVEKGQGIQKGGIVRLGPIEIVSARWEPLRAMTDDLDYGFEELRREGFPLGAQFPSVFVEMICRHYKKTPDELIHRLEYKYLD